MSQDIKVRTPGLTASGAITRQVLNADTPPNSALLPLSEEKSLFTLSYSLLGSRGGEYEL